MQIPETNNNPVRKFVFEQIFVISSFFCENVIF